MKPAEDLLALGRSVAAEAGAFLLDGWERPRTAIETKSSLSDLVSEMDKGAEELIVQRLLAARPDDSIVGEEGANRQGTSGVRWIIDPLDGTTNYLYGIPIWSVSVAAELHGDVIAGIVECPRLGETVFAAKGSGAWLATGARTRQLAVRQPEATDEIRSDSPRFARSLISTGFWANPRQGEVVAELMGEVRDVRRCGSAAIDLAWVAAGRTDAYYELGPHIWDVAAGLLCVREAGGSTTYEQHGPDGKWLVGAARTALHGPLRDWLLPRV